MDGMDFKDFKDSRVLGAFKVFRGFRAFGGFRAFRGFRAFTVFRAFRAFRVVLHVWMQSGTLEELGKMNILWSRGLINLAQKELLIVLSVGRSESGCVSVIMLMAV